jgi:hypothetical protein
MDVKQELGHLKRDDESLGMNKIHVVFLLHETILGFKEELCSLETSI